MSEMPQLPADEKSIIDLAEGLLADALVFAVESVIHTAKHADNERLRYIAATYIIDRKLPKPDGTKAEDWEAIFRKAGLKRVS